MFDIPSGETFWSVFEKEREKYLAENVEELKKERNFANKLQLEVGPAISNTTVNKKLIERTRSTSISSTSTNSILNLINQHVCNIDSPLSSTASSSINHSPISASSNHSQHTEK